MTAVFNSFFGFNAFNETLFQPTAERRSTSAVSPVKHLKKSCLSPIVFDGLHLPAVDVINGTEFAKYEVT